VCLRRDPCGRCTIRAMRVFSAAGWRQAPSVWALVLVLPVIAVVALLQYRWIDRVSQVEEQTRRQRLESDLQAFADDFDTEITRVHLVFADLIARSSTDAVGKAHARLQMLRAQSAHPGVVKSVDVEPSPATPYTVDPGPPPSLTAAVAFALAAQPSDKSPFQQQPASHEAATGSRPDALPPQPGLESRQLRIRIVLDEQYIVSVLASDLLERHLGPAADQHYDVLINRRAGGDVLLRWGNGDGRSWDGELGLFAIRPDCLLGPANQTYITTADLTTRNLTSLVRRPGKCVGQQSGATGIWTVSLRMRPGLGEVVNAARRQSLAISFGVLLALAAAITVLVVAAHRARELAALHEQFAAGVSHELRTPLSVISSASENLGDGIVEDAVEIRRYGKMIHAHAEQLAEMIENALWFARRNTEGPEAGPVDAEELVHAAADTCSRILENAEVVLERDVEPGLPAILGNRTLLLHGLQNLLTNVAKHGQAGKWARIRAARAGEGIVLSVEDRGNGIPADEAARVLDPFYRGARAKKAGVSGLGLGLSFVGKVVTAHSGRIQIQSGRGAGTTVTLTVPVAHSDP
jgi:signal transduction histidine kinase